MKNKWLYIWLIVLLGSSCQKEAELPSIQLVECSPMPEPVAAGCSFAYNKHIYILGGRNEEGKYSNHLWRFATTTGEWERMPGVPIKGRVSHSACVWGNCAYIGMGYQGPIHRDTAYLRDFWEYNMVTNEWRRLADFPANTTVKNCLFAGENAIYALYGFYRQFTQDIYQYDIQKDQWEKLDINASASIPRAMDVVGATCQGRHFIGTGFNHGSLRFWAEWNLKNKELVSRKKILGPGRNAAACCATNDYVYLAGGRHYGDTLTTGFFYNSIQRYSPQHNEWEYVGSMPYEGENMVMCSVDGQIFIGMGETPDGRILNNWYKFEE